jgi:hypothetical protein
MPQNLVETSGWPWRDDHVGGGFGVARVKCGGGRVVGEGNGSFTVVVAHCHVRYIYNTGQIF